MMNMLNDTTGVMQKCYKSMKGLPHNITDNTNNSLVSIESHLAAKKIGVVEDRRK